MPFPWLLAVALPTDLPAERTIADLAAGRYAAVEARMAPGLQSRLPQPALEAGWRAIAGGIGGYRGVRLKQLELVGDRYLASLELTGQTGQVRTYLVFDGQEKLATLWADEPRSLPSSYRQPPYAHPEAFTEREVVLGATPWSLPGTLTLPRGKGPFPAVVLVCGSGPNDRDESIGENRPFKDWAWGLASRGIAVLRYDKLTYAHGYKLELLHEDRTLSPQREVVDGAVAGVQLLKAMPEVDPRRIAVLGHSQGGGMLPRIGRDAPGVAGLVSLAGPLEERTEDGILRQVRWQLGRTPTEAEARQLEQLEHQAAVVKAGVKPDTPVAELPLRLPPAFWSFMAAYKPAEEIRQVRRPMFFLQGGRDYQVLPAELEAWKRALAGRKDVKYALYPRLDHEFHAGDGPSTGEDYVKPAHVDGQVVADVAGWLQALPQAPAAGP